MRTIYLHGHLKELFGEKFVFDVPSPTMAICALRSQLKGFAEAVREHSFHIVRGTMEDGLSLDIDEMNIKFGNTKELHIVPVISGGGGNNRAVFKIVIGVALIAVGVGFGLSAGFGAAAFGITSHITYGTVAALGVAMTLTGISQMLTPRADIGAYEDQGPADERPSFLFDTPTNQGVQGVPVPLVYGQFRVGSVVISRGLKTEKI
jgi:predicted phage tail protein